MGALDVACITLYIFTTLCYVIHSALLVFKRGPVSKLLLTACNDDPNPYSNLCRIILAAILFCIGIVNTIFSIYLIQRQPIVVWDLPADIILVLFEV